MGHCFFGRRVGWGSERESTPAGELNGRSKSPEAGRRRFISATARARLANRRLLRATVTPPSGRWLWRNYSCTHGLGNFFTEDPTGRRMHAVELAAHRGLDTMESAETNPKQRGFGKSWARKMPPRFDQGSAARRATMTRLAQFYLGVKRGVGRRAGL